MISKDDYIKWTKRCDCACVDNKTMVISKMKNVLIKNVTVMNRLLQKKLMALKFFKLHQKFGLS
jgi:hypothetical protein